MTLQQLRYIVALDIHRHFADAADACMVTQPTLTMQVKKLEDEMGLKVFDRGRSPIVPTPIGTVILSRAREILQHSDALHQFVTGVQTDISGEYNVAIIPTLAPYLLPRFLPEFIANYPKTKLNIREMQTETIIDKLKEGSIDLGILVTPLSETTIREVPLFQEPFYVYGDQWLPEPPFIAGELPQKGLLLLDEGHCFRDQALEICSRRNRSAIKNIEYLSGSIESLKALVRKGMGYTLIPALSADEHDEAYIHRFEGATPVREVSVVVHQSFVREKLLEVLRDVIIQTVPEEMRSEENYFKVRWRQV